MAEERNQRNDFRLAWIGLLIVVSRCHYSGNGNSWCVYDQV